MYALQRSRTRTRSALQPMYQLTSDKRTRKRSGSLSASGSKSGFTLIEVMVGSVLMLVVFAGGFGALIQGNRLIESSRDETRASQILQSEIEDLRTHDWTTLTALPTEAKYNPQSSFTDAYAARYTIKRVIATRSATQKRITLMVAWQDSRSTTHTREYITLITKDGLYDYYYRSF